MKVQSIGIYRICGSQLQSIQISVISGTPSARTRAQDPTESSGEGRLRVGDEPKSRGKFYRIFRTRVSRLTNAQSVRTKKMKKEKDKETRSYKIEGIGIRKGRPKSLNFIASLNGLQLNTHTRPLAKLRSHFAAIIFVTSYISQ